LSTDTVAMLISQHFECHADLALKG